MYRLYVICNGVKNLVGSNYETLEGAISDGYYYLNDGLVLACKFNPSLVVDVSAIYRAIELRSGFDFFDDEDEEK